MLCMASPTHYHPEGDSNEASSQRVLMLDPVPSSDPNEPLVSRT